MSQPSPESASLDGLRILARLVAEAWRSGGIPPSKSDAEVRRQRRLPVTATLALAVDRDR